MNKDNFKDIFQNKEEQEELERILNNPTCSFQNKEGEVQNWVYCFETNIYNKKKQLCRNHHQAVRQRFNEFLKSQSVGSTAAWEMEWEVSSDWKRFWDLKK